MAEAGRGASDSVECGHGARESDGLGVEGLDGVYGGESGVDGSGGFGSVGAFLCNEG